MLRAVAQAPGASYQRIALLAHKSPRSSSYEKAMRALRARGLVVKASDDAYEPTAAAEDLALPAGPAPSSDELIDTWIEILSGRTSGRAHGVLLDVIRTHHPQPQRADDLEEGSHALHPPGYSARSSTLEKATRYLRDMGFVEGSLTIGYRLAPHTGALTPNGH